MKVSQIHPSRVAGTCLLMERAICPCCNLLNMPKACDRGCCAEGGSICHLCKRVITIARKHDLLVPNRTLGVYLFESALRWLDLDRLLQEKVEKAGGQVLEYAFQVCLQHVQPTERYNEFFCFSVAFDHVKCLLYTAYCECDCCGFITAALTEVSVLQHEMSRGLSQILSSKPQLTSKQLQLGVEVRQRDQSFTADQQLAVDVACATEQASADAQSIEQERSPLSTQKQQAVDYSSAHATMPLASLELDKPVHPQVEEVTQTAFVDKLVRTFTHGQLDKRRLDICVGSYGFELMSGGSRAQVEEHAARSLVYAKLHGLELVFAVHFIVQRATTRQQPVTFPTWPAITKANEEVPLVRSCDYNR